MQAFITQFGGILLIATAVVIGVVAVYGIFDKKSKERRDDEDKSEDRLINLLKNEVAELTKKVDKQALDITILSKKIDDLEQENETLVKVLQGRDSRTEEFQERAHEVMDIAEQTHHVVKEIADGQMKLLALLERHMSAVEGSFTKQ